MQQANKSILIGFPQMAVFRGVSIRRIFRHRQAMRAASAIEDHFYRGCLYSVAFTRETESMLAAEQGKRFKAAFQGPEYGAEGDRGK